MYAEKTAQTTMKPEVEPFACHTTNFILQSIDGNKPTLFGVLNLESSDWIGVGKAEGAEGG